MSKRPWSDFSSCTSQTFVKDLLVDALPVSPIDLCDMRSHRRAERVNACGGHDPIRIHVAYAQDYLAYDDNGVLYTPDEETYKKLPREKRLNKFGLAYRHDAQLYLHKTLGDIIVGAAVYLYNTHGWRTVIYDGLRTMEGAYKLYCFAPESDITGGLLALPGQSAHNKGMAVDSMMEDANGHEVDMGGHFDHLDMESNNRVYTGYAISIAAKQNRLIREAAFLRSALTQNMLVAPLRSEFWDDRLPENREDLWRVLDSAARCLGITLLTAEDLQLRKTDKKLFSQKWERWSYSDFLAKWREVFKGREAELIKLFGIATPPVRERVEFYHGNYQPIYDRDLVASGKNLTC
ncbi:MAG: M15 family metallopeptidase [Alphaproteobacteria bacterium]